MKNTMVRRNGFRLCGFTLMELLIVIAVIATLAGLMMPALGVVRRRARNARARTEINSIEVAWKNYLQEYSKWPSFIQEGRAYPIDNRGNPSLMKILQGREEGGRMFNYRKYAFMEFSHVNESTRDPLNPWGNEEEGVRQECLYYVKFDANYDNKIAGDGRTPPRDVFKPVVVWTQNDRKQFIGNWPLSAAAGR